MQGSDKGSAQYLDGHGLRIGIVQARFNESITNALAAACRDALESHGVQDVVQATVPGALEVPVALASLIDAGGFDALVALGCIIRGETYHFELVANESGSAVTRLALDHRLPIANAILTVENEAQAWARAEEKGRDAGLVAIEMARLVAELKKAPQP